MSRPVVLTIAGFDPSGGAGVTADLRVIESLGCIGVSAVTALTVQNTRGVTAVHATDPDALAATLESLFPDIKIQAVKIGMLAGHEQVEVVADVLRRYQPNVVVLDPVFASTGGVPLLSDEGVAAMVELLLPLADVVTPNLDEAERIAGFSVRSLDKMRVASKAFLELGAKAVLVKGGHLVGEPIDLLAKSDGTTPMGARRIDTEHTHGTGCFLSSALASNLALGQPLTLAVENARAFLRSALENPIVIGKGRGYPGAILRRREAVRASLPPYGNAADFVTGIYVLTDTQIRAGRSHEDIAVSALAGGARVVQLRAKDIDTQEAITVARRLTRLCTEAGAVLIVNDRVDIAIASGADGVHLGPDDMSPHDARRLLGPNRLVGVSVATLDEAEAAAPYASYFGVGAVFGTKTKLDAGKAIGTGRLSEIKARFPGIPIVAIGGITLANLPQVRAAGVESAAVVSAVVGADDMVAAVRELVSGWG